MDTAYVTNKSTHFAINMQPNSGSCYDFLGNGYRSKKTIWLVPHVIKYKDDSEIITWRCNWGNCCTSLCLYAMNKDKNSNC